MKPIFIKIIIAILAVYVACMVVIPLYNCPSWKYLQDVLSEWQTLNAAMIAFASTIIIYYISIVMKRRAKFKAARAFLLHEISLLCTYLKQSFEIYITVNDLIDAAAVRSPETIPMLPDSYTSSFKECIEYCDDVKLEDVLVSIVEELQVLAARMRSDYLTSRTTTFSENYINENLCKIAVIQAKVNRLFMFCRDRLKTYNSSPLVYSELETAFPGQGYDFIHSQNGLREDLQNIIGNQ